nr:Na+/H+ antiporter [uncultured bacterium]
MRAILQSLLILIAGLLATEFAVAEEPLQVEHPQFKIEVPDFVLTDVPVPMVRISAYDVHGDFDPTYDKQPYITGIRLAVIEKRVDGTFRKRDDAELPPFHSGVLELHTDLAKGRKVYITADQIVVDPDSRRSGSVDVYRTWGWLSLVPPLLAIGLAAWLRNVILALFAAVWSGAIILSRGDFFQGFLRTLDTHVIGEIVQIHDGRTDHKHLMIILFTMFLGAMSGVIARSGGTQAMVDRLSKFAGTRERGQLAAMFMGLFVFFDHFANKLLVGSTIRPLTDRLKVSREKLAFLVDSTSSSIAALAIVSTWVGIEIGFLDDVYRGLYGIRGIEVDTHATFLGTLAFRFYPLYLLVFAWLVAYSGNDFLSMRKAENRAQSSGDVFRPGALTGSFELDQLKPDEDRAPRLINAIVPIVVLMSLMVLGLWWTGTEGLVARNFQRTEAGMSPLPKEPWTIIAAADPLRVLFISSFLASVAAVIVAAFSRSASVRQSMDAWAAGAKSMFFAALLLVLAWSVATLCDAEHLNTVGFLIESAQGRLDATWIPSLAFLFAGAVAFATGSSWTTVGLLLPLFVPMTYFTLVGEKDVDPNHFLMLGTIGATMAGTIFGSHCSPLSESTIFAAAACGSDHLDHVVTQAPYAITVALVSLAFGYIPIGFGHSPLIVMPFGLIVMYLVVEFVGRSTSEATEAETTGSVSAAEAVSMIDGLDDAASPPAERRKSA